MRVWLELETSEILVKIIINPPIRPRLVNTKKGWKGEKCIINVVGTIKSNKREAPNLL